MRSITEKIGILNSFFVRNRVPNISDQSISHLQTVSYTNVLQRMILRRPGVLKQRQFPVYVVLL